MLPASPIPAQLAHGGVPCQGSLHSAQGTGSHVSLLGSPSAVGSAGPGPPVVPQPSLVLMPEAALCLPAPGM